MNTECRWDGGEKEGIKQKEFKEWKVRSHGRGLSMGIDN